MSKENIKSSEIKFDVSVDENHVPTEIEWTAEAAGEKSKCKALFISLWDEKEKNTMRIDLWTKEMTTDEMKQFFHQSLVTMADSFERATGEKEMTEDMRDFTHYFAEKMDLLPPEEKQEKK